MMASYRKLEQAVGYRFKKKALLELALTHPSFRYEDKDSSDDNQRLEYLGDAVLSLIAAEHLFKNNPEAREGDMSKLRSRLTQDRKLAQIGAKAGIGEFLMLGRGEKLNGGAKRASNLADAVEAIIGAAWIDGGARAVNKIFKKIFLPELEELDESSEKSNPKGNLQEYAQSHDFDIPEYETVETAGPEHDRIFTVEVKACGKSWKASAGSKREGERKAAFLALEELRKTTKQPAE
ncbi:ribonuclease III [Pontiella sulfatireligans]|uniref:Ribonuclease 3 n=1 Tax=Pontiella sulfatireligans TaxID=2750658 RepID=A0A6C2USG8_9BACT|nr:ribonuclease III [Pontiella sulfatireligans]VGO23079.1 Ribonuclease 3 [Pontiella sulfatireligans]